MKDRGNGRLPPFVPLLKDTLDAPAWRAMSHGARSLYIALKRRYNSKSHNNGRLYLSHRTAAKEIGSDTNQITRWFHELHHYGFIVQTEPGCLGVNGKGQAPRRRLTEIGYLKEPPTRDFTRWDGTKFSRRKKQNPVREYADAPSVNARTPPSVKTLTLNVATVRENTDKGMGLGVRESTDKSSIPLGWAHGALSKEPEPSLIEGRNLPKATAKR